MLLIKPTRFSPKAELTMEPCPVGVRSRSVVVYVATKLAMNEPWPNVIQLFNQKTKQHSLSDFALTPHSQPAALHVVMLKQGNLRLRLGLPYAHDSSSECFEDEEKCTYQRSILRHFLGLRRTPVQV
jgi:hypothetical protein